jgi:hypothetical protein
MRKAIDEHLRTTGRVVCGAHGRLISVGGAFRRMAERRARKRSVERKRSDIDRLKQLGGRPRSDEEDAEFIHLSQRNPDLSRAYFDRPRIR